jgi:hypothetical protein
VDAATKSGLLDLLEQALGQGWTVRAACGVLELSELRVYRWLGRRTAGELADQAPGGSPMHGRGPAAAAPARPGRSVRKPFPDWVDYRPGSIWIYDTERHEAPGNREEVQDLLRPAVAAAG